MGSQVLEMVTGTSSSPWHPWTKITKFTAKHGRKFHGPAKVSVWHKPNTVQLDFHNHNETWGTWLNLTPDEALRVAQGLIKGARAATSSQDEDE